MKTDNIDKEMLDTTDKETQSPVHRVFQKLIEIEHRNPEKARLIVENTEKKVHCCPKFIAKSYESDRCDRRMVQEFVEQKKVSKHPSRKSSKVVTSHLSHPDDKTSSYYAQVYNIDQEKSTHPNTKESWSYWKNDKDSDQEKTSTSCAFKTILNSQYCGVACLVILFIISVLATLLFVCRPQLKTNPENSAYDMNKIKDILDDEDNLPDSVKFKRKLEELINKNNNREDDEDTIVGYKVDKKYWDDSDARDIASLMNYDTAFVPDLEQSNVGLRNARGFVDTSNIDNENLRNFYQKFVEAEAQMKYIKKHLNENMNNNVNEIDRQKRSIIYQHKIKHALESTVNNKRSYHYKSHNVKENRHKRYSNKTNPKGFVIEHNELQFYIGIPRKLNKSCNSLQDIKYLQNKLIRPLHKNTKLVKNENLTEKNKIHSSTILHKETSMINNDNNKKYNKNKIYSQNLYRKESHIPHDINNEDFYFDDSNNILDMENNLKSSTAYDLKDGNLYNSNNIKYLLSNLETSNSDTKYDLVTEPIRETKTLTSSLNSQERNSIRVYKRKLLQAEDDIDNYSNEDNIEDGDETEDGSYKTEVEKRSVISEPKTYINEKLTKPNLLGINSNEINNIIGNAALQNIYSNIHFASNPILVNDKEKINEPDKRESNMNDMEYIEDYMNRKNQKYVKYSQAYSDYGVLNEKKESTQKSVDDKHESLGNLRRIKVADKTDRRMLKRVPLFGTSKTKTDKLLSNDDFQLKIDLPTSTTISTSLNNKHEIMKYFEKFLKIVPNSEKKNLDNSKLFNQDKNESLNILNSQHNNELDERTRIKSRYMLSISDKINNTESNNLIQIKTHNTKIRKTFLNPMLLYLYNNFIQPWLQSYKKLQYIDETRKETNKTFKTRSLLSLEEFNSNSSVINNSDNANNNTIITINKVNDKSNKTLLNNDNKSIIKKNNSNINDISDKTLVKRDINENNLIFWNDIYDEEYGVKDPLDDYEHKRELISNRKDMMKKSEHWLKKKVKNLKHKLHHKENEIGQRKEELKHKIHNEIKHYKEKKIPPHIPQRIVRFRRGNDQGHNKPSASSVPNFEALNANMKNVFREAVNVVQNARTLEVRESETKNNAVATSLMQQLVNLMTDLVDYQVQQKTCKKLPPDLQEFLLWLTAPDMESNSVPTYIVTEPEDFITKFDIPNENYRKDKPIEIFDLLSTSSGEKEVHPDIRPDCLGTLRSFENLIQQYNNMNEEEKKKMSGVKQYLERQKEYLQREVTKYDNMDSGFTQSSNVYLDRYRRDMKNIISRRKNKIIK